MPQGSSGFHKLWQNELAWLVGLGVIAFGLLGFVLIANQINKESTQSFDEKVLLSLRNPADRTDPLGPRWVEELGRDFTAMGGVAFLTVLSLSLIGYLVMERKPHMAGFLAVTILGGILLSSLLKHGFNRPRPELVPHGSHIYTSSFPSGHSMMAAVTYLTLAAVLASVHQRRRVKSFFLVLGILITLAVGISRVYLGVHWPTDVLAGWTVGAVWSLGCCLLARHLQRRGQLEPPGLETRPAEEMR